MSLVKSWIKRINQDREEINASHHIFNGDGQRRPEKDFQVLRRMESN